MQAPLGVALDQIVQAQPQHTRHELEQSQARAVAMSAEIGGQGLGAAAGPEGGWKGLGGIAFRQRRQDRSVGMQRPE